jgi:hypothetical protein
MKMRFCVPQNATYAQILGPSNQRRRIFPWRPISTMGRHVAHANPKLDSDESKIDSSKTRDFLEELPKNSEKPANKIRDSRFFFKI